MRVDTELQHVPLDSAPQRFSRRTLALLPAALLGGAAVLGTATSASAAPSDSAFDNSYPEVVGTSYGTCTAGTKLTARWVNAPVGAKASYQWQLDGKNIAGATASTFTPTAAMEGKTIGVEMRLTFVDGEGTWATWSTLTAGEVELPRLPWGVASVIGKMEVGQTLSVKTQKWPAGTTFEYQWHVDYVDVKGATKSTFRLTPELSGCLVGVTLRPKKPGYWGAPYSTGADSLVLGKTLAAPTPTISGSANVGSKLTAKTGTWGKGVKFFYQWKANGAPIKGATSSTFTLTSAQAGKTITLSVRGELEGYLVADRTSKATAKVAGRLLTAATPKISGTTRVGSKLTAKPGTWTSGTKLTYQWYLGDAVIKGATASTLVIPSTAKGKQISVKVTGTKSGYATTSKTSAKTAKIAAKR